MWIIISLLVTQKAGKHLTDSLARKIEYPADGFQPVGRTDIMQQITHVIGLDIVFQITPLYQQVIFSQRAFGQLWVGRIREHLSNLTKSDKLRNQSLLGHQASRMKPPQSEGDSQPSGLFATTARSFHLGGRVFRET